MRPPLESLPAGPPGPPAWNLVRYSHMPLPFLERCAARFGDPFTVRFAGYGSFVMLSSPDAVRDCFRADPAALHSGEENAFLAAVVGDTSVLVLDGAAHARQRRILLPPLKGERMRAFFDAIRVATVAEADSWPVGRPVRMVEAMQRITLRVIAQAVLGLPPGPESADFEHKVGRMLALARGRYTLIWVKLIPTRLLNGSRLIPYFRQLRELDELIYALIARRRREPSAESSVLAHLLAATHDDGSPMSDREVRDAVVTMLTAGHDTTALALAWALERIVPRADVTERLCAEFQGAAGPSSEGLRPEHLDDLKYLDAAIRESMRVRTVLPFVVRVTKRPFVAGGREYPAGVVLCPCNHLVHRRPDLYPDPAAFRPERFLERRFAGHEYFPFGGGHRACLGMAFAMYEMRVVLATLLGRVRLSRPKGAISNPVRRGIALAPDDGAVITVSGRR